MNSPEARRSFEQWFHAAATRAVDTLSTRLAVVKAGSGGDQSHKLFVQEVTEAADVAALPRGAGTPLLLRYRRPVTLGLMVNAFKQDPQLEADHPIIQVAEPCLRAARRLAARQRPVGVVVPPPPPPAAAPQVFLQPEKGASEADLRVLHQAYHIYRWQVRAGLAAAAPAARPPAATRPPAGR
jgi:hypothetical protein